jgi:SAM-dependent methyltransferase
MDLRCPACDGSQFEALEAVDVAAQHKFYAPGNEAGQRELTDAAAETCLHHQMLRCIHCGLEVCSPLKAPTAGWYHLAYRARELHGLERWEFDEVLRRLTPGTTIFEFGCGTGNFLSRCKDRGIDASGIDFSQDAIAECRSRGLNAWQNDLYRETVDGVAATDFVAFHFLEHLDRPAALFESAAKIAQTGSRFWITVPSDRRGSRVFGLTDFLDQPPHHMTRWTTLAFKMMGERHGWLLEEAIYEPMPLRTTLWWVTVNAPMYRKLRAWGWLKNRLIERIYRFISLPACYLRWKKKFRNLTGFSVIAVFSFRQKVDA